MHVKDPVVHVRQSLVEYGNTKRPIMHLTDTDSDTDRRINVLLFCTVNLTLITINQ